MRQYDGATMPDLAHFIKDSFSSVPPYDTVPLTNGRKRAPGALRSAGAQDAAEAFHAPHPLRLPLLEPTHEALDRLVGTQKSILLNQILIDSLGAQAGLHLEEGRKNARVGQEFVRRVLRRLIKRCSAPLPAVTSTA